MRRLRLREIRKFAKGHTSKQEGWNLKQLGSKLTFIRYLVCTKALWWAWFLCTISSEFEASACNWPLGGDFKKAMAWVFGNSSSGTSLQVNEQNKARLSNSPRVLRASGLKESRRGNCPCAPMSHKHHFSSWMEKAVCGPAKQFK